MYYAECCHASVVRSFGQTDDRIILHQVNHHQQSQYVNITQYAICHISIYLQPIRNCIIQLFSLHANWYVKKINKLKRSPQDDSSTANLNFIQFTLPLYFWGTRGDVAIPLEWHKHRLNPLINKNLRNYWRKKILVSMKTAYLCTICLKVISITS